jgi:hypothetical protein
VSFVVRMTRLCKSIYELFVGSFVVVVVLLGVTYPAMISESFSSEE